MIDKEEAQCGKSIVNSRGGGGWEEPFNTRHRMKEYYIRQSVVMYMKEKVKESRQTSEISLILSEINASRQLSAT